MLWTPGQIMLGQAKEKMSDLENDSGFITEEQAEIDYVKTSTFEELVQRVEVLEGSGT